MTTAADARETPSLISSEKVQGTPVRRPDGEKIGTIEHLMIEKGSGQVAYAVMSFGGFLGLGQEHYALPWQALRYNPRLDAYELEIDERAIADAPRATEDRLGDRTWELQIHNYFGYPPYWQ
jgi:hypothetical protein